MTNRQRADFLTKVLMFLSSGKTVLTNSYHGAYWALLMHRPVVIFHPFSNRFYGFKPKVSFADESNWQRQLAHAETPPKDYLDECRYLNVQFGRKVTRLLTGRH
jgi:hypothetical protein